MPDRECPDWWNAIAASGGSGRFPGKALATQFHSMATTATVLTGRRDPQRLRVAYIASRFPKLTETFVLYEMLAVEQQGAQVELYPLQRERTPVVHPEAAELVRRAHFQPFISWRIGLAHLHYIRRNPSAYFRALASLLRGTWGSPRFFMGALIFFPKTVFFAYQMELDGVSHVHAHFASHPAAAAFVIQRLTGIPYSFTAHGSDLHRDRHMLRAKVAEAAFVVAISNYNRQVIVDSCGDGYRKKVAVIHCGVDTSAFRPRPHPATPAVKPLTILCVGTLHEVKGQTYLIEACRLLRKRGIDVTCRFVGVGPDHDALSRQAAHAGLQGNVFFLGARTRQQVIELLASADVLVAPSVRTREGRREGIPVVLMEAMGSGVPVIASRLSGIPELVEHEECGLLTEPRDASGLAEALERLHSDPALRRRLSRAGREKVVREFDVNSNASLLAARFGARRRS